MQFPVLHLNEFSNITTFPGKSYTVLVNEIKTRLICHNSMVLIGAIAISSFLVLSITGQWFTFSCLSYLL